MRKFLIALCLLFTITAIAPAAADEVIPFDTYPYSDAWATTDFGNWLDIPVSDLESLSTETLIKSYLSNMDVLDWMEYGHVADMEWMVQEILPEYPYLVEMFERSDFTETLFSLYEKAPIYDDTTCSEMTAARLVTKEGWENRVLLWEAESLEKLMLEDQLYHGFYSDEQMETLLPILIKKNAAKLGAPDYYQGQSHFIWAYYAQETGKLLDPLEYITEEYLYENALPEDLNPIYVNHVDAYTPMGEKVDAIVRLDELTQEEFDKLNARFSGHEKLGVPTYRYNGFSYAFYSQDTENNRYWIDDFSPYVEGANPSYYEVKYPYQEGDVVVLYTKEGIPLAAGIVKMNPPGSFYTCNILCKFGYGGAYNVTPTVFKGQYRSSYGMRYFRKVENDGYWEQEWPLTPILYDDEVLSPGTTKLGTPEWFSYTFATRKEVPAATLQGSSTIDLIKLLLETTDYSRLMYDEEERYSSHYSDILYGEGGKHTIAVKEYFDPILYTLFRREDFTKSLFEAYKSNIINPCYVDRNRMRKINAFVASDGPFFNEQGRMLYPEGMTEDDFYIALDITRHEYLEHLMLLDQARNGLYTEEEKSELTKIFNAKNAAHKIDFELFGPTVLPAGGYYNNWECLLHGVSYEKGNVGYRLEKDAYGTKTIKVEDYKGGGRLALDNELFHPSRYLNPSVTDDDKEQTDNLSFYKCVIYTQNGQALQGFYKCRPNGQPEIIDITPQRYIALILDLWNYEDNEYIKRQAPPTWNYNCHSYVWWYQNTSNVYRIDDVKTFATSGCFKEIPFEETMPGDIVFYYTEKENANRSLDFDKIEPIHSAIMWAKGKTDQTSYVRSKWGEGFLVDHRLKCGKYYDEDTIKVTYFHPINPVPTEPLPLA